MLESKFFISETNKIIESFYEISFNPEGFHSFFVDSDLENIAPENSVVHNHIIEWDKCLLYIKNNYEVNCNLLLQNSGVGKTTFINTIIKSNIFETSDDRDMCVRRCQIVRFDDPYGKSENEINKIISENPNFKYFILLFRIDEKRIK